jgi:hypothetical protein
MAGSRTLKLSILADVDDLRKKLSSADNDVQGFGDKLGKWSKVAGAAFLAAGAAAAAYAGKLAIDGVKAAIEDEAAQLKLATTLKNVTNATDAQTKAVEDYILKTELAYGVTDDQLRPSLDRLVRSTKDVSEAQRLQTLALNISAGTGKELTAVSEALAKAHDGNFGALKRLGVSIDESIIKSKDFDAATAALATTFKDQASIQADTFDGKMRRLSVAFNEGKETVGAFILDAIQPMVDFVVKNVVPALQDFAAGIGGGDGIKAALEEFIDGAKKIFIPVFEGIKYAFDKIKDAVMNNKDEFKALFDFLKTYVAPLLGGALKLAIQGIGTAIGIAVEAVGTLIGAFEKAFNAVKKFVDFIKNNPITRFFTGASDTSGGAKFSTAGYMVSENATTAEVPSYGVGGVGGGSGAAIMTAEQQARFDQLKADKERLKAETQAIKDRIAARAAGEIFGSVNVTVNGALDAESTARQIRDILTQSAARGGGATDFVYA